MKNLFFVISVVCGLLILAGCGNTSDGPRRPIIAEQPAPQPPAPKPEPPKPDNVTVTSASPFHLSNFYEAGSAVSQDGPDSEPIEGNRSRKVVSREQFKATQYATMIPGGNTSPATIAKFVRIPPSIFADPNVKSLNLDDPKLEVLPAAGWKLGRIIVYIFRSEFGDTSNSRKMPTDRGKDAKEKTLDELQRSPYFWAIRPGPIAEVDVRGMLTSFSVDGVSAFLTYVRAENSHKDSIAAIKKSGDQNYTAGYQATYLAGQYQYLWGAFNKLPQPAQMAAIDAIGPLMAQLAIEKVGPEVIHRYVTDLTWAQIERCPVVEPRPWPHSDPDAPIANYGGLSNKQYADVGHAMLFWGRRGQPVFERCKAVFLRELGKTPAASTPTRNRR